MNPEQAVFFDRFYGEWFPKLCRYALSAVKNPHVAEEIVQDAFLVAMLKIDSLMEAEAPERWMKKTVKNKILHYFREQKRDRERLVSLEEERTVEPAAPDLFAQVEELEAEALEKTRRHIRTLLTAEELALIQKIALEGKSYQEVSEELGVSLWACQKRVQRIRKKIKLGLEKNEGRMSI